jgi:hypothetical protein
MTSVQLTQMVAIKRHWTDWRGCQVPFSALRKLHWGYSAGGHGLPFPQPQICGYIWCNAVPSDFPHSCAHGERPHHIKVVVPWRGQNRQVLRRLLEMVGPQPGTPAVIQQAAVPSKPVPLPSLDVQ